MHPSVFARTTCFTKDIPVLKTLLDSHDKAYRGEMEYFMWQVNGKLNSLQYTVADLTKSLEFTQQEVEELKQTMKQHEQQLKYKGEANEELNEKLEASVY